jgi:hypothetical protein
MLQKRFKTKQEMRRDNVSFHPAYSYALGLPFNKTGNQSIYPELTKGISYGHVREEHLTTDPHTFDNLDIKVRVTPKQSKKLQKKAFKMGYEWSDGKRVQLTEDEWLAFWCRDKTITHGNDKDSRWTELTYKQFINGTVPKREFKVGDWVEVIDGAYTGEIGQITKQGNGAHRNYVSFGNYNQWKKDAYLKHTTKPKEKPLTFKGHEVEIHHDPGHARYFNCGCVKSVYASSIVELLELKARLKGEATLDELAEFAETNKTRLGL